MQTLTPDSLRALLASHEPPCLSLYQPTHRRRPENQQDPIRFRNLIAELEASLLREHPNRDVRSLMKPFRALAEDVAFWDHTLDGLAVLASVDWFRIYRVQRAVPELAVVATSFHTKPLVRILQSADRFQVLGLNRHECRLYEGNRDALDEMELAGGVPRTIEEALGDPPEAAGSAGAVAARGVARGAPSTPRGHAGRKGEVDLDVERFFRAVDRAVLEHHSRPSGLPLLLAALPEHHALFRSVSHNSQLRDGAIGADPKHLAPDTLRKAAWRVMEPYYLGRLGELIGRFEEARSKDLGSADVAGVARALVSGRVGTLLVEAGRQIPGSFDRGSGAVKFADLADPRVDDLLDDLAALAFQMGGDVVVVPRDRMPVDSGLAAIYRF